MSEHLHAIITRLQFVVAAALILSIIFMISLIVSTLQAHTQKNNSAAYGDSLSVSSLVEANVITVAAATIGDAVADASTTTVQATKTALSVTAAAVTGAVKTTIHSVASVFIAIGRTGIGATLFVVRTPSNTVGFITHASRVDTLIKASDTSEVPIIDPHAPELQAALAAISPQAVHTAAAGSPAMETPLWPLHGAITTYFGVPHRPYQVTHTGMDISDGTRRGTTPIHPFLSGTVMDVVLGNTGLGNHVVIDHGAGITSVYGHMNAANVSVGQRVDQTTVLGWEGTTGVSTGVHLHFEIRINNQAVDPRHFIQGAP